MGNVATSVPLGCLFSTADNIVTAKRAALLRMYVPENLVKLIFLHENLNSK